MGADCRAAQPDRARLIRPGSRNHLASPANVLAGTTKAAGPDPPLSCHRCFPSACANRRNSLIAAVSNSSALAAARPFQDRRARADASPARAVDAPSSPTSHRAPARLARLPCAVPSAVFQSTRSSVLETMHSWLRRWVPAVCQDLHTDPNFNSRSSEQARRVGCGHSQSSAHMRRSGAEVSRSCVSDEPA